MSEIVPVRLKQLVKTFASSEEEAIGLAVTAAIAGAAIVVVGLLLFVAIVVVTLLVVF